MGLIKGLDLFLFNPRRNKYESKQRSASFRKQSGELGHHSAEFHRYPSSGKQHTSLLSLCSRIIRGHSSYPKFNMVCFKMDLYNG